MPTFDFTRNSASLTTGPVLGTGLKYENHFAVAAKLSQKFMCDPKKPESFKTTIYTLVQVLTVIHVYLHLAHVVLCAMRHVSAAARSHRQSILTQHGIVQHPAARLRTLFPRLLKISSLTFRPKTPSFQKFQFLKFTYFPLFLN